ncbi:acylphosphatase [Stakelama tenebrarum]|uniref:Acylphosphatase n=1 Tax=Stakelama tenebrarum TaxID=2711215 RepID=A0A6G6Y609_9SPHN|nr:acylphosphatase [Sphingosinithalassobacter tenebrarum]QIG80016.1 acylphosphatase [Sphingosinithalassobacter tenebrarum]
MIARHVFVSGRVQGVFFRDWTVETARALGLTGWVRNLSDGRVEVVAQGDENAMNRLLEKCREGSEAARVDKLDVSPAEPQDFTSFERAATA